jgi:hypothetical protein
MFEVLFLTVKEERGLRVSDMSLPRRIFGCKIKEGTGGWKELHNEDLHDLYPHILLG